MLTRIACGVFCIVTFSWLSVYGQKNCGTVAYQESLKNSQRVETEDAFEIWLQQKLKQHRQNEFLQPNTRVNQLITIPVVVHIVHNGESIGSGSNIEDSRIIEQIERLNKDFRRLNADTANTPMEFRPVAADTEIEFVLAKRDPYGLPTDGINRVKGERSIYDLVHNTELKALSYWPAEDYLNLWVAELESLLGYAQFPVSSLEGLEIASENRLTDGVVIDTDFFGVNPALTPESIGRTCTHEVGHFLGLRHIWGDGGCSVDDFCGDTPRSNTSNYGCPDAQSCGSTDMVQNYMDLSDDLCMNLFTQCQRDRMRVVLGNSPRRYSLTVSSGATAPVMVDNDAGIRQIIMPYDLVCDTEVTPQVIVQNTGTNTITSVEVQLLLDGNPIENQTLTGDLEQLETITVSFSSLTVADMSNLEARITSTNGGTDGNPENNSQEVVIGTRTFDGLPILEIFDSFPSNWEVRNNDNSITWELADAPSEIAENSAARISFFNYDNSNGEYDYLISPALDLTTYTGLTLSFDFSYAQFSAGDKDGLIVAISEDCGNTFSTQNYVFFKQGNELATAPISGGAFVPSGRNDWSTEVINLDQYAGLSELRIAFIAVNDYGNNLYLDNISLDGARLPDIDLAVASSPQPIAVLCPGEVTPTAVIKNTGLNTINDFQVSYTIEDGTTGQLDYTGPPLTAGQSIEMSFEPVNVEIGPGIITYAIQTVDGQGNDGLSSNGTLEIKYLVDDSHDLIPSIENFDGTLEDSDWNQLSQDNEITWEVTSVSGIEAINNQAAFMNFYNYQQAGELDYLVSPALDFTTATTPTMTFNLAYAGIGNFQDGLLVVISSDCGKSYADTVFQAFGEDLATTFDSNEFYPQDSTDWKLHKIDLSKFAGLPEIRVALVAVNDFGNNLFIDNVQFFLSDRTNSLNFEANQMVAYPNPTDGEFSITFNLTQRSPINLQLINTMGQAVWDLQLPDVLNQTYEINLVESPGIYILQATGAGFRGTSRIIVL